MAGPQHQRLYHNLSESLIAGIESHESAQSLCSRCIALFQSETYQVSRFQTLHFSTGFNFDKYTYNS
uniref:Uncharacterized protein n=1 Tax=Rhizophora mucronata TaxID=61149 RepID=A0A2P2J8U0_RHIMU